MSLPPQASFSSATTAVASRGTVYPSDDQFTSFKLPLKASIVEPTRDDVSDLADESNRAHQLNPHPFTPTPPSPVPTESSNHDFVLDDTPSTIHGESMLFPRYPLATRAPSVNFPVSPRWPFQNATPRQSLMVPIVRSITESSRGFNQSAQTSPVGQVSMSESLDEFQTNHPNAQLLALHPRPLTYNEATRNLVKIPTLIEKPRMNIAAKQGTPMTYEEKPFNSLHNRRWSRHLLKLHLRRHHKERNGSAKPPTSWYQRISVDTKIFRGSAGITMFFLANSFVSVSALITLAAAGLTIPYGIIVWVIVSLSTCFFTVTIFSLMRKFRNAVAFDEEHRGRSPHPKLSLEVPMQLPASPTEVYHRRKIGAAVDQMNHQSVKNLRGSEMFQSTQPSPVGQAFEPHISFSTRDTGSVDLTARATPRQNPSDPIETYWTDISIVPSANSEASSMTAVINSAPKAPTNNPDPGC